MVYEQKASSCDPLTCSMWVLSADNKCYNLPHFLTKFCQIVFVITIFGFSTKNAFKWVQTSLVLGQQFLKWPLVAWEKPKIWRKKNQKYQNSHLTESTALFWWSILFWQKEPTILSIQHRTPKIGISRFSQNHKKTFSTFVVDIIYIL